MFAVVDISGTQEKVSVGDKLSVPIQEGESGTKLTFANVFMIVDGDAVTMGAPHVSGASVEATVIKHGRGDKIRIVKTMRRKRYKRTKGHRQGYTNVEITRITA